MAQGSATEVIVYSSPFCVPCEELKRYLTRLGVDYQVRDLMMDEEAQDRLEQANVRSAPALEVDGAIYAGAALTPENVCELVGVQPQAM